MSQTATPAKFKGGALRGFGNEVKAVSPSGDDNPNRGRSERPPKEKLTEREEGGASPTWETLGPGAFARQAVRRWLQRVLEKEVDGVSDRGRYERRAAVVAGGGYRNGYGKPPRRNPEGAEGGERPSPREPEAAHHRPEAYIGPALSGLRLDVLDVVVLLGDAQPAGADSRDGRDGTAGTQKIKSTACGFRDLSPYLT